MKHLKILIIIAMTILLSGCMLNNPKYISFNTKPTIYYYSNELYEKIKSGDDFTLKVFDNNLYKYYDVGKDDYDIISSFITSLNTNNYVDSIDTKDIPVYKLIITFSDIKYIINVYSKSEITLYPWDGNFDEDYINMENVSPRNNIYSFCTYIINKANSNNQ